MPVGIAGAHCGKCGLPKEGGTDDYVAKKAEKLTDKLGLSAEQSAQAKVLIKEKMEKKHTIMQEKSDAIEAVKEEYSAKLAALLNDEQKVKYEAMQAEWKEEGMKGSHHDHKGSGYEHKGSGHK